MRICVDTAILIDIRPIPSGCIREVAYLCPEGEFNPMTL